MVTFFVFAAIKCFLFNMMVLLSLHIWPSKINDELFRFSKTVAFYAFFNKCEEIWMMTCCEGTNMSASGRSTEGPLKGLISVK